jgi:hypothetical protein
MVPSHWIDIDTHRRAVTDPFAVDGFTQAIVLNDASVL